MRVDDDLLSSPFRLGKTYCVCFKVVVSVSRGQKGIPEDEGCISASVLEAELAVGTGTVARERSHYLRCWDSDRHLWSDTKTKLELYVLCRDAAET